MAAFEDAGGGVTGAKKASLEFPDGISIEVKWKDFPRGLDGWNNSPRKEIAAYQIQKWFLDPEHYVVPTTVARCVDVDEIRGLAAVATLDKSRCVLVTLAVWLQNVTVPDKLYDEERFLSSPDYAFHMANFNILTTLIDHRDGRKGNFLSAKSGDVPRVYAADNGISFSTWIWNYFVRNWEDIRVPALPRPSVERLRGISAQDYASLAVLLEMRLDESGMLRTVEDPGPPIDPDEGARWRGGVLQLGLTQSEIDEVRENVEEILEAVDGGELAQF